MPDSESLIEMLNASCFNPPKRMSTQERLRSALDRHKKKMTDKRESKNHMLTTTVGEYSTNLIAD